MCGSVCVCSMILWSRDRSVILITHPDTCFSQIGPHCDLFSGAHVRVAVPLKGGFQLLELLAGEMSPLASLFLLQRAVLGAGLVQMV